MSQFVKKIIFFSIFLLSKVVLFAQTYDASTIDKINNEATKLIFTGSIVSIDRGITLATEAATNAELIEYTKGRIEAYKNLEEGYTRIGNNVMAEKNRKKAQRLLGMDDSRDKSNPFIKDQPIKVISDPKKEEELKKSKQLLESQKKSLEEMEKEITKKQDELSSKTKDVQTLLKEKNVIENQLGLTEEQINEKEKEIKRQSAERRLIEEQLKVLDQEKKLTELEIEKQNTNNKIYRYSLIALLLFSLTLGFFIRSTFIANKNTKKALEDLKKTQEQLILSEKLASLGQLTAGVAHEIQNPLNFVNNLSETTEELILEFVNSKDPKEKDEILKTMVTSIQKIKNHGKRAASIVRGMLSHSRDSRAQKQDTDLNELVIESINLSLVGFKANNKNFNCEIVKNLSVLPKVKIIKEDIGRVLLNIANNSFYAMNQKSISNISGYKPKLEVTSRIKENNVILEIEDNGTGLTDEEKKKLFEPFFTTKPTGQGTGLGMSISREIILAHNGSVKIIAEKNSYTKIFISLPTSSN